MPRQGRVHPVNDRARSFGTLRRLSVAALACGALFVPAQAASAANNKIVLWGCHGPAGQPLGTTGFVGSGANGDSNNVPSQCTTTITTGFADGLHATLPAGSKGGAESYWRADVSNEVKLTNVRALRQATGFTDPFSGTPFYSASTSAQELENNSKAPLAAELNAATTGDWAKFSVSCPGSPSSTCAGPAVGFDISAVALTVTDPSDPHGAVGQVRSPATGKLDLKVSATDSGVGLAKSVATLDGTQAAILTFGDNTCAELSPNDSTVDYPMDANCPATVTDKSLPVDISKVPDGNHTLVVTVSDAAGNTSTIVNQQIEVDNTPIVQTKEQQLTIGNEGTTLLPGGGTGTGTGSGGVQGASDTSCNSPKLSMFLSQKPLRVSHGVPVLSYAGRYRFRGRLTCVVGGKRKSATRHTRVDLANQIGKKVYEKGGATVRDKGGITMILSYKSSRTLIFRFTNLDGKRSQVKIKITVTKKPKAPAKKK
jgi:hypothetical protein